MSSLVSPLLTSPSPSAPGADPSPVAGLVPSALPPPPAALGLLPSVPGATLVSEGASPAPSVQEVALLLTDVADAEAFIRLLKNWLRMIFSSSLA